jgi:DNA-directed RNA polymerase specialized sigma24 family protein
MALRRARKTAAEVYTEAPLAAVPPVDNELGTLMHAFYDTLDAGDQAVFDACFVEELSQAKAGAKLDRSRDQVYRSLTRIRQRALRFFKKKGWLDDA